jgi:uncharacterized protein YndB with AHSA1/START domain
MERESPSAALSIRRVLPASPQEVFEFWTKPELLIRWLSPYSGNADCQAEIEARVGGRIRLLMRGEDRECAIQGQYVEFDPPVRLAFTWAGPATDHAESLVTVELHAIAGGTELTLLHERLPNAQSRDNHAAGWAVIFDRLNEAVAR